MTMVGDFYQRVSDVIYRDYAHDFLKIEKNLGFNVYSGLDLHPLIKTKKSVWNPIVLEEKVICIWEDSVDLVKRSMEVHRYVDVETLKGSIGAPSIDFPSGVRNLKLREKLDGVLCFVRKGKAAMRETPYSAELPKNFTGHLEYFPKTRKYVILNPIRVSYKYYLRPDDFLVDFDVLGLPYNRPLESTSSLELSEGWILMAKIHSLQLLEYWVKPFPVIDIGTEDYSKFSSFGEFMDKPFCSGVYEWVYDPSTKKFWCVKERLKLSTDTVESLEAQLRIHKLLISRIKFTFMQYYKLLKRVNFMS
jgi:hypothetical protein